MDDALLTYAETYFTAHLDKAYWLTELDADTRTAALTMAENDITSLITQKGGDATSDAAKNAICEQAVFLARNYENMNEGKVTTSEGVGDLSQGYTLIGNSPGISPRAETFIKQALSVAGRIIHLRRG